MKIGYARVSTDEQHLDLQLDALIAAGCDQIFTDRGTSGVQIERNGLRQALSIVGYGDTLVVWRLDRLGRSLGFLIELIENLGNNGAGFKSLTDGIDTTTTSGKFVFHIMGALAEFERSLIADRTKAGMAAAKQRGKHIGRPRKLTPHQVKHARLLLASGQETRAGVAALLAVDVATLRRALNGEG